MRSEILFSAQFLGQAIAGSVRSNTIWICGVLSLVLSRIEGPNILEKEKQFVFCILVLDPSSKKTLSEVAYHKAVLFHLFGCGY